MNELIPYLMKQIQSGGTSLVPSGYRGLAGRILDGEILPPKKGFFDPKPYEGGPIIDGEAVRGINGPAGAAPVTSGAPSALEGIKGAIARGAKGVGGSLNGMMANPLMAAIMGAIQGDVLNNHHPRMYGPSGPAVPQGAVERAPLPPPQAQPTFEDRYPQMAPAALAKGDMLQASPNQYVAQNFLQPPHVPMPQPRPAQAPSPVTVGGGQVPMPVARPAQAPQDMNFFMRNALMMRDPATGSYIDPAGAARAQASGGDLIQKMLGLLHNKANNA